MVSGPAEGKRRWGSPRTLAARGRTKQDGRVAGGTGIARAVNRCGRRRAAALRRPRRIPPPRGAASSARVSRKPNSVGLLRGDHLSGAPVSGTPRCDRPWGGSGAGHTPPPLCGLAPGGVYRAGPVTGTAGALLPHRFTLARSADPLARVSVARWRSALCCTFRGLTPPGSYPAPCPVEFGLSSTDGLGDRLRGSVGTSPAITWETRNSCRAPGRASG
jgi:hypothetical protein